MPIPEEGGWNMIQISKQAIEKLKGVQQDGKKNQFRVFISGIGWGGPKLGLALDEPKATDKNIEVEGLSFIVASEVADTIRSYGPLFIDYKNRPWTKGIQLTLQGMGSCWFPGLFSP